MRDKGSLKHLLALWQLAKGNFKRNLASFLAMGLCANSLALVVRDFIYKSLYWCKKKCILTKELRYFVEILKWITSLWATVSLQNSCFSFFVCFFILPSYDTRSGSFLVQLSLKLSSKFFCSRFLGKHTGSIVKTVTCSFFVSAFQTLTLQVYQATLIKIYFVLVWRTSPFMVFAQKSSSID